MNEVVHLHGVDLQLARSVAAGDVAARERMVRQLMRRVRAVARRLVSHSADVDDVAQVAMLQVLHSAGTYQGHTSLERWSDRISARVALRHQVDSRRRLALVEPAAELPVAVDERARTDVLANLASLEALLRDVPEAPRLALQLKYGLGFTVEEIAEATGAPPNTVKTRLKLGLRALRARMGLNVEAAS